MHIRRRQDGLTLVEVLVALVLMGTALITIAAAVPAGLVALSSSGLHLTALGLAGEPLNLAKRTAFADLPGLAASRAAVSGFDGFDREVLVADFAAPGDCAGTPCSASCPIVGGAPTCRTVEVRVYYKTRLGDTSATLTEVLSQ